MRKPGPTLKIKAAPKSNEEFFGEEKKYAPLPHIERTGIGLRDALFDEIDQQRDGTGNRQRALTVAALAKQIVYTFRAEVEFHSAAASAKMDEKGEYKKVHLGRNR